MGAAETAALVERLGRLRSSVVGDCLDRLGANRFIVGARVRPLDPRSTLCGAARTALAARVYEGSGKPYFNLIRLVDSLHSLDVPVISSGGNMAGALWGELLTTAARARGAAGLVLDGPLRDAEQIMAMGFPAFTSGITPADSYGRLEIGNLDEPIECGEAKARHGDLVLGDFDGVLIVPRALAEEAIRLAEEKTRGEDSVRAELARGRSVAEVFAERGIL